MYRLEREEFVKSPYIALWSLLGFQAGYINAFGFLACGRYVSHVTGFGTQIGIALGTRSITFAIELLGFPIFFILGSFCGAIVTAARIERGLKPWFGFVTASIPLLLLCLYVFGFLGWFGAFGEELLLARDFFLLFLLSFICGTQNGCFAVMTKGQIRTTHLTGISTDIGTDLARLWFGNLDNKERGVTQRTNFSRIATFVFFAMGSIVSVHFSGRWGYSSLAIPLATSVVVFLAVRLISKVLDHRFSPNLDGVDASPNMIQLRS
ncbi:MAG: hypothetical protein COT74_09730 [Bdellovibrionales bacterium CG10_big_fil_rev_8_21_14_0_10_45_34]|nr:MAG: hypothetical protein COT74_09730 [Bdellovibrionales bacterium CG10_big_fil_rev_8_21_14_0_10_45_34]